MVQMPAYVQMAGLSWRQSFGVCTVAALVDLAITLSVVGLGALAAGELRWGMAGRWNVYVAAALLGGACAVVIAWKALESGRWSYSERMPVVPILGFGLWPLVQLCLLLPVSFGIARWWARRRDSWETEQAAPING